MKIAFDVVFEKQEVGYTAYVPALPGCISQGETKKETIENINEAITLYLEETNKKKLKKLLETTSVQKTSVEIYA